MPSKSISLTAIGDTCLDIYPQKGQTFLGGAAFNLSLHAQKAGAQASLISAVGTDSWGQKYLSRLKANHINSSQLTIIKGKTSHLNITLNKNNQPTFSAWKLGVLKNFKLSPQHKKFLLTQDAAIAVLFKPISLLFNSFVNLKLPTTLKVGDFSGSSDYDQPASIINSFSKNLDLIVKTLDQKDRKSLAFLKNLAKTQNKLVLVLLGDKGSQVFTKNHQFHQPIIKTTTKDTTGAGDAYLATFVVEYLKTKNIPQSMLKATKATSRVISKLGAN